LSSRKQGSIFGNKPLSPTAVSVSPDFSVRSMSTDSNFVEHLSKPRSSIAVVSAPNGMKKAIDVLITLLGQFGPPPESTRKDYNHHVSGSGVNQLYLEFMSRNEGRNIDLIREKKIFYEGGISKVDFYFPASLLTYVGSMSTFLFCC
jgi:hypothetical protein